MQLPASWGGESSQHCVAHAGQHMHPLACWLTPWHTQQQLRVHACPPSPSNPLLWSQLLLCFAPLSLAAAADYKSRIVQRGGVPPLIRMLSSSDLALKEMAAFALGRLAQNTHNQAGIVQVCVCFLGGGDGVGAAWLWGRRQDAQPCKTASRMLGHSARPQLGGARSTFWHRQGRAAAC